MNTTEPLAETKEIQEFLQKPNVAWDRLWIDYAESLLTQRDEARQALAEAYKRDGKWYDKHGVCRVCDGEIPDGHMDNCDIWKLEQQIHQLTTEREHNANMAGMWESVATDALSLVEGFLRNYEFGDEPDRKMLKWRDAYREAKAHPRETGWRPIESAPKDGKLFWGCHENYYPDSVHVVMIKLHDDEEWKGCQALTHWMPLPPAPVQPTTEKK